jgi:hypothetical protein
MILTKMICIVWIDHVSLARPMVPEKDKLVDDRRTYPAEVRGFSIDI